MFALAGRIVHHWWPADDLLETLFSVFQHIEWALFVAKLKETANRYNFKPLFSKHSTIMMLNHHQKTHFQDFIYVFLTWNTFETYFGLDLNRNHWNSFSQFLKSFHLFELSMLSKNNDNFHKKSFQYIASGWSLLWLENVDDKLLTNERATCKNVNISLLVLTNMWNIVHSEDRIKSFVSSVH